MALIGPPDPRRRRGYTKEVWYARVMRGKSVVSKWPEYKRQRTAAQQYNEHHFAEMSSLLSKAVPGAVDVSADYAKRFKMRVSDWKNALASGTLLYWDDPDGRTCTGWAWRDMMTHLLDTVCPGFGTLLIRYQGGWWPISAGQPGDVLTATADGPAWAGGVGAWKMAEDTNAAAAISRSLDTLGALPGALAYRGPDRWTVLDIGAPGDVLQVSAALLPEWVPTSAVSPVTQISDGAVTGSTGKTSMTDTLKAAPGSDTVFLACKGSSGRLPSITDSRGGAWSLLQQSTGGGAAAGLYRRNSGQTLDIGDTVTATMPSSTTEWGFESLAIAGVTQLGTVITRNTYTSNTVNGLPVGPTSGGSPGLFLTLLARGYNYKGRAMRAFGDFNFVDINPSLQTLLQVGWGYSASAPVSSAAVSEPDNAVNMTGFIQDLV